MLYLCPRFNFYYNILYIYYSINWYKYTDVQKRL